MSLSNISTPISSKKIIIINKNENPVTAIKGLKPLINSLLLIQLKYKKTPPKIKNIITVNILCSRVTLLDNLLNNPISDNQIIKVIIKN